MDILFVKRDDFGITKMTITSLSKSGTTWTYVKDGQTYTVSSDDYMLVILN